MTLATRENLTGVRAIRAFHKESDEISRFEEENDALSTMQIFVGKISALMNPITYIIVNVATIVLLQTGAIRVEGGLLTQGAVVALVNYMSQILVELVKLANLIINVTKAWACGNRIEAIFEVQTGMEAPAVPQQKEDAAYPYSIEFDHVSMRYDEAGAESLTDIDFKVKKGQTLGIIGSTGSGKTSLVHLIPRYYDVSAGSVRINGVDVRAYDIDTLRSKVGMVLQKAMLFAGSIEDNLRWGKADATNDEIRSALEIAQAAEVVDKKEGGLSYLIEQEGRNLSGGQRQRLTIARALVRQPEILILDDSASALDYATDARLRKALREHGDNMTVVIVSQRTSSIQHADQILVLEEGELVGVGTHEQLLQNCEVYREIHASQYQSEEAV